MKSAFANNDAGPLGDVSTPAPSTKLWTIGILSALMVHIISALPFLPKQAPLDLGAGPADAGIGIRLAPTMAPPKPTAPEPEPETPQIEERAEDSPPPAPPAQPREKLQLPDIRPRAVPDIWFGGGEGGDMSLDDYLSLGQWHAQARDRILQSLSYPLEARRQGISGVAIVVFTINKNGRILKWSFRQRTGEVILDREIERSLNSIRRLPKLPADTKYDVLSFSYPIRFELVYGEAELLQFERRGEEAPAAAAPPANDGLSVNALRLCAATADDLTTTASSIAAQRAALEAALADYERQADRYVRDGREPPLRVRNMLKEYERGVSEYDAMVRDYNARVGAFESACGSGKTNWENFLAACAPYAGRGNAYCEAFGELWLRLK